MAELKDILINLGAIAGVASIIGLAVLAMLYFSQARDVRRLREWAGREPERAAEVELRAAQIASQAIAQAYESMAMRQSEAVAAAAIAEEQGVVVEMSPATAEHAVEPVVSGMEGAVDDPAHEEFVAAAAAAGEDVVAADEVALESGDAVAEPAGVTGEHAAEPIVAGMEGAVDDPEHVAEAAAAEASAEQQPEEAEAAVAAAQSATVNGQASPVESAATPPSLTPPVEVAQAGGEVRPSRLAPSTPAATRGQIPLPPLPPLDTSEFLAVNRPTPVGSDFYSSAESTGAGGFESVSGGRPPEQRGSRTPFVVAGILVAIFALVLIGTQLTGEDEPGKKDASAQRQARDRRTTSTSPRNPQINRPAVTVTVLNGTQTAGLARIASEQLIQAGFSETTSGNRNDNVDHVDSVVYYAEGSKLEAEEVAKELTIKSVKKIDEDTQAAGGSVPVVVVLGADFEQ